MADAASTDPIYDTSTWTWNLVIERLLGIKVSENWEKVHGSTWVEFESFDHTSKKPDDDDTKLVYWRSSTTAGKWYSLPGGAGHTGSTTSYKVVKVKIPYQGTDGGNPKDIYVNWATTINKADLLHPDSLNSVKTDEAINCFIEARDLARSLADGLAGLIAGTNTKASGFAGSAAAALAYDLDAIKKAFRTIEWDMSSGQSGDLTGGQYIWALTEVRDAQKKFCAIVDDRWRTWINKADGPADIIEGINKQIGETWGNGSFNGDDGWVFGISYKGPLVGESAPSPIKVDLREKAGWTALDRYARDLWKASIVDALDAPVREAAKDLQESFRKAKTTFTNSSYNVVDGLAPVKGSDGSGGSGGGDESDIEKIVSAFKEAMPKFDDPTEGTDGGAQAGWPDLPTDDKGGESGWPGNPTTDAGGNGDWASVMNGGGVGDWPEHTDNGGGWSGTPDADGEVTYPGIGSLTPNPWDAGSKDSDSKYGSSGVYSDFREGDLPEFSSASDALDSSMLPTQISEGHSSAGGIGGIDSALDPLKLDQQAADEAPTVSVLGDSVGSSPGSGAGMSSGYGGMPMSPMAGGAGAGQQEKERERTTWLAEEEEVWGTDPECAPAVLGRFDDDVATGDSTRPAQQSPRRNQPGQVPTRQQIRGRG